MNFNIAKMVQKQNGILQWKIILILKVLLVILTSCNKKENTVKESNIGYNLHTEDSIKTLSQNKLINNQNMVEKEYDVLIEEFADSIYDQGWRTVIKSPQLSKEFRLDNDYFIFQEEELIVEPYFYNIITPLTSIDEEYSHNEASKRSRYLLISKNNMDCISFIKVQDDYASIKYGVNDVISKGIAVGVYRISSVEYYFEIQEIFGVNQDGIWEKLELENYTIYDCLPTDYMGEEPEAPYRFGIKGGEKSERKTEYM